MEKVLATVRDFREFEVWEKSHQLTVIFCNNAVIEDSKMLAPFIMWLRG